MGGPRSQNPHGAFGEGSQKEVMCQLRPDGGRMGTLQSLGHWSIPGRPNHICGSTTHPERCFLFHCLWPLSRSCLHLALRPDDFPTTHEGHLPSLCPDSVFLLLPSQCRIWVPLEVGTFQLTLYFSSLLPESAQHP